MTSLWDRLTKRFFDWAMEQAKTNSDFSYREYREMQEIYKDIYGEYYASNKSANKQSIQS